FSVSDDGAIIEGLDYALIAVDLMPLSSDGLMVWQSASESIAALMMGNLGEVSEAVSRAIGTEDEDALEPYKIELMKATAAAASEVREIQAKALERVLGMPVGSAALVRSIDLGEDLFKIAWDTVSAALTPAKPEGKGKSKTKAPKVTPEEPQEF
ncbi:MAG: hypothetical protein ACRCZ9_06650, partial [Fusobacteriaceae bacterium]